MAVVDEEKGRGRLARLRQKGRGDEGVRAVRSAVGDADLLAHGRAVQHVLRRCRLGKGQVLGTLHDAAAELAVGEELHLLLAGAGVNVLEGRGGEG